MIDANKISKANYELLGPIFYRFLFKLYFSQSVYNRDDTIILFLARGGIRIRAFYEDFLSKNNVESPLPYSDFYISRMAIIKASLISNYESVYQELLKEYAWYSIGKMIATFFGREIFDEWSVKPGAPDPESYFNQDSLNQAIWGETESANYLREVLDEQRKLYFKYCKQVMGDKKSVIVVDTGWSGSILNFMQELDRERNYTALYFGRYNYGKGWLPWFNKVMGVEVEDIDYNPRKPITSLFLNRHLVEGLSEIRWASITGYKGGDNNNSEPIEGYAPEAKVTPLPEEAQAYGVMQYINDAPDGLGIEAVHKSGEKAAKRICKRLKYPNKDDLSFFSVKTRSADFGKELDVPVFAPPETSPLNIKKKLKNIKDGLWPTGQITLEFPLIYPIVQFLYHRSN